VSCVNQNFGDPRSRLLSGCSEVGHLKGYQEPRFIFGLSWILDFYVCLVYFDKPIKWKIRFVLLILLLALCMLRKKPKEIYFKELEEWLLGFWVKLKDSWQKNFLGYFWELLLKAIRNYLYTKLSQQVLRLGFYFCQVFSNRKRRSVELNSYGRSRAIKAGVSCLNDCPFHEGNVFIINYLGVISWYITKSGKQASFILSKGMRKSATVDFLGLTNYGGL